jgi:hypothetical protein
MVVPPLVRMPLDVELHPPMSKAHKQNISSMERTGMAQA